MNPYVLVVYFADGTRHFRCGSKREAHERGSRYRAQGIVAFAYSLAAALQFGIEVAS